MHVSHFLLKSVDVRITRDEWVIEGDDIQTIEIAFNRPLSDEMLWEIARQNPGHKIEQDKNGKLYVMPPVGLDGGFLEGEAFGELRNWHKEIKLGKTYSPSTGFKLPDGSTHAADGVWVSDEKIDQLTPAQRKKFAPIVPDFVIEVRSESDNLKSLKDKMKDVWIANGVRLAWLIDPLKQKAYIYRQDGSTETVDNFEQKLSGEDVCPGFEFDLGLLKL